MVFQLRLFSLDIDMMFLVTFVLASLAVQHGSAARIEKADLVREAFGADGQARCDSYTCPHALEVHGPAVACSLPECGDCGPCAKPPPPPARGGGVCSALARERQVGLKCGKHAVNAVLANLNMTIATENELDARSQMIGAVSHGDDYDISVLQFFLMVDRGLEVQQVGALDGDYQTMAELVAGVGSIGSTEGLSAEEAAAYEAQRRTVNMQNLPWVICNPGGHWKTYFHYPGRSAWCDLDSIPARQEELTSDELANVRCVAAIVPTSPAS